MDQGAWRGTISRWTGKAEANPEPEKRKRKKYRQNETAGSQTPKHVLDISAQELKVLQETDATLGAVQAAAEGQPSTAGVGVLQEGRTTLPTLDTPGTE